MIHVETYRLLLEECSAHGARLIAVSKDKSVQDIRALYDLGQRKFGENRVQELVAKAGELPADIEWYMIGHLQTNKVKLIVPLVTMIQSVDSYRLLVEVNKRALHHGRVIDCLLQMHIAKEETKFGFDKDELEVMLQNEAWRSLTAVRIRGLMGIATMTDDVEQVRGEFRTLRELQKALMASHFAGDPGFSELSMGMSSDYRLALQEGSTMIRVGSLVFGSR